MDIGAQRTGIFADELEQARREGVSPEENLPFLMEPAGRPMAAVLLVHGFTASPWEMRLVGEALAQAGFVALGVCLPGHGTVPEDLHGRRYEEWQSAVERGGRLLEQRGLRLFGVGQSTGGLLLLAAAASLKLEGLVLLSPYLRLRHRLAPVVGLLRFFRRFQHRRLAACHAPFYYDRRPVQGIHQLQRLIRRVRKSLGDVNVPALVVSAAGDATIDVESAADLFRRLGSESKQYHVFGPEVSHILTTEENPRLPETLHLIRDFLKGLMAADAPGAGKSP